MGDLDFKVMTVVGTRPEIIRLSRVIEKLDKVYNHTLVHTGQNYDYELNEIFFDDLEIRQPDVFLEAAGNNAAQTISQVISKTDEVLEEISPDAVLVLGDTNSCLALLPAKRRKIATFHMEAGNRCFDMRVPEEINRRLVDHLADVNLPYSSIARDYLLREGLPPDLVIKTGSPMAEVLSHNHDKIINSDVLARMALEDNSFYLFSIHREENVNSEGNFNAFIQTLNCLAQADELPIIVSTHPRTRQLVENWTSDIDPLVRFCKPLSFSDYNKLQIHARAVLSDSGTINEEASILNFRALNLREAHERPEGMEEAVVIMTGLEYDDIRKALDIISSQPRGKERLLTQVADYQCEHVSEKIIRIIASYTPYVNRVVWRQY